MSTNFLIFLIFMVPYSNEKNMTKFYTKNHMGINNHYYRNNFCDIISYTRFGDAMRNIILTNRKYEQNKNFYDDNFYKVYNWDYLTEKTKEPLTATEQNELLEQYRRESTEYNSNLFKNGEDVFFMSLLLDDKEIFSIARFNRMDNYWFIDGVETNRAHFRKGYAEKCITNGMNYLLDHGLSHMKLRVGKNNERAIALYTKLGFEIEDVVKETCPEGDVRANRLLMGLNEDKYNAYLAAAACEQNGSMATD